MKKLKTAAAVLLCLLLCGCKNSRIFANYRELKQTELIQTVGFDKEGKETAVTVATAVSPEGDFTIFTGRARTASEALANVHSFPSKRFLFFGHTGNIIIGNAAAEDMTAIFDFIERNNDIRLDTPLFVARGISAKDIMHSANIGGARITELLLPLTDQTKSGAGNRVFTAKEMIAVHTAENYALACAIKLTEDPDTISEGSANVIPDGYAVIRGGGVVGFVEQENCLGVNLIINQPVGSVLAVKDSSGGFVSLSLKKTQCEVEGQYSQNGGLEGIVLKLCVKANIEQVDNDLDISFEDVRKHLAGELSVLLSGQCQNAVETSRHLETDFLGLGKRLYIESPARFEPYLKDFRTLLEGLDIKVQTDIVIERTYDIQQGEGVE